MSTASTHFATLVDGLNRRTGLALRSIDGACAFLDKQGAYWQISLGRDSDLIVIACTLGQLSDWPAAAALRLLELNTRHDVLRGASLGVDPVSQDVRAMLLLPMAGLDAALLENAILNLMGVRDAVAGQLADTDAASTAPEFAARQPGPLDFA